MQLALERLHDVAYHVVALDRDRLGAVDGEQELVLLLQGNARATSGGHLEGPLGALVDRIEQVLVEVGIILDFDHFLILLLLAVDERHGRLLVVERGGANDVEASQVVFLHEADWLLDACSLHICWLCIDEILIISIVEHLVRFDGHPVHVGLVD